MQVNHTQESLRQSSLNRLHVAMENVRRRTREAKTRKLVVALGVLLVAIAVVLSVRLF